MRLLTRWILVVLMASSLTIAAGCGGDDSSTANNKQSSNNGTPDAGNNGTPDSGNNGTPDADNNGTPDGGGQECADGEQMCGDACVDTSTSLEHCGGCDSACEGGPHTTATCESGSCNIVCEAGYNDNNNDKGDPTGDGCEDTCGVTNGGVEICDGIDNDCDGTVDEDDADDANTWYADADDDGFGDANDTTQACDQPAGYVDNADDCDDTTDATNPDADEVCDNADNDCDGDVDEEATDTTTFYADADSDTFGDANDTQDACSAPSGYVANADDCDDTSDAINPDADEVCDSVDNDCDGDVDEDSAVDAETFYADADSDTYGDPGDTQTACSAPSGYVANADDCDDTSDAINPDADEVCDSVDNNCDGTVDEDSAVDATTWHQDQDGDGYGSSITQTSCTAPSGFIAQGGDCDDTNDQRNPSVTELCDGVDNNCDNTIDEGYNKGDSCSVGQGVCENTGTYVCTADGSGTECNASPGTPQETTEQTCDDLDNDCDGVVDNGCDDDADGFCDSNMTVSGSPAACSSGTGDCDDNDDTIYPGAPGLCDNKDNDCNGDVDDIQLVSSSPASFTMSSDGPAYNYSGFLPTVLSAPADDGFCVIAFDDTANIIEYGYVKADGTHAFRTSTNYADIDLLDVAWNGSECGALYRQGGYALVFSEWDTSAASTGGLLVTQNLSEDSPTVVSNAALHPYRWCLSFGCSRRWMFAYVIDPSNSSYQDLVYSTTGDHPNLWNDNPTAEQIIDGFVDGNTDVAIGPSPSTSDELALVYKDGSTMRVVTATGVNGTYTTRSGLELSNATNFGRFAIAELNNDVYLSYLNTSSESISVRKMTSTYQYGGAVSAGSTNGIEAYVPRVPMSSGPGPTSSTFGWFVNPFDDKLYRASSGLCGLPPNRYPCSFKTRVQNSNPTYSEEYIGMNGVGDYLQVLRVDYVQPMRLEIDEFTCY